MSFILVKKYDSAGKEVHNIYECLHPYMDQTCQSIIAGLYYASYSSRSVQNIQFVICNKCFYWIFCILYFYILLSYHRYDFIKSEVTIFKRWSITGGEVLVLFQCNHRLYVIMRYIVKEELFAGHSLKYNFC